MFSRLVFLCAVVLVLGMTSAVFLSETNARKAPRWNMPWLWMGVYCNGCPARNCEQDEAIIHGYCCGCAYSLDILPITCPDFLQCPLNLHGLCHDYEYMMRCCC